MREPAARSAPSSTLRSLTSHRTYPAEFGLPTWTHQRRHAVPFAQLACLVVLAFIPLTYGQQCSGGAWSGGGSPLYDCGGQAMVYAATSTTMPSGDLLGPSVVTSKCLTAKPTTVARMETTWWVHILHKASCNSFGGLHSLPVNTDVRIQLYGIVVHAHP